MDAMETRGRSAVVGPSKPRLLGVLGPGLISGASDDDPTAIATYSQAGARFGCGLLWLSLVCLPIMVAVQEISARIGRTTGQGLAANIRQHYPAWLLDGYVFLLLAANTIEIGADLGAMADVVHLVAGGPHLLYVVALGAFCVAMQVFMRYTRYVAVLKWTTLTLLAYFAAVLMAHVNWGEAAVGLVPRLAVTRDWITTVVAIFGVAISPYIFYLAIRSGSRGRARGARARAAGRCARASAVRAAPHPARHLRRHGGRHPGRARDHADHLGHAPRDRQGGHPELGGRG